MESHECMKDTPDNPLSALTDEISPLSQEAISSEMNCTMGATGHSVAQIVTSNSDEETVVESGNDDPLRNGQ